MPTNYTTKQPYTGSNALTLGGGEWATFIQWRDAGFKVKKGSKGTRLGRVLEYSTKNKEGKLEEKRGLKTFVVFNREQVEALAR